MYTGIKYSDPDMICENGFGIHTLLHTADRDGGHAIELRVGGKYIRRRDIELCGGGSIVTYLERGGVYIQLDDR